MALNNKDPAMFDLGYERVEHDFYPTEFWVTEELLNNYRLSHKVWEPCAGTGAISVVLQRFGFGTYDTDLIDRGYPLKSISDFLSFSEIPDPHIHSIVTNPPYHNNLPYLFIEHACSLMRPRHGIVAFLCRHDYDTAKSRNHIFRSDYGFACKLTLCKRPRWFDDNKASPRHNYAWYIWDFNSTNPNPIIKYGAIS